MKVSLLESSRLVIMMVMLIYTAYNICGGMINDYRLSGLE